MVENNESESDSDDSDDEDYVLDDESSSSSDEEKELESTINTSELKWWVQYNVCGNCKVYKKHCTKCHSLFRTPKQFVFSLQYSHKDAHYWVSQSAFLRLLQIVLDAVSRALLLWIVGETGSYAPELALTVQWIFRELFLPSYQEPEWQPATC